MAGRSCRWRLHPGAIRGVVHEEPRPCQSGAAERDRQNPLPGTRHRRGVRLRPGLGERQARNARFRAVRRRAWRWRSRRVRWARSSAWLTFSACSRRPRRGLGGKLVEADCIPTGLFPFDLALGGFRAGEAGKDIRPCAPSPCLWPDDVCVFNIETFVRPVWARRLGVNTDKLVVIQPNYGEMRWLRHRERAAHGGLWARGGNRQPGRDPDRRERPR